MLHVRQQRGVHRLRLRPVGAVHVPHVQVVALRPPSFVEDLLELGYGIDVGADRRRQSPTVGRRRRFVGIDEEQGALRAAGAVEQLLAVRADDELRGARHERGRATGADLIPVDRAATPATAAAGRPAGARRGERLEEEHRARRAGRQLLVVARRDVLHGDDALLDAVDVDADCRNRRRAGLGARLTGRSGPRVARPDRSGGHGRPGGVGPVAPRVTRRAPRARGFLVALRQQRRRVGLREHGQVQSARLRTVVRRHVEQPGMQREIGRREEPQILPARVPRRRRRIGEAVGDLSRLAGLDVVQVDRAEQRLQMLRVGDPLRVRTPRRDDRPRGVEVRVAVGDLRRTARDVDEPQSEVRVLERELPPVRRPGRSVRPARLGERDLPGRRQAVLRRDVEPVLARLVAEIRHRAPVGRPDGEDLRRAARVRQVSRVALLGGDR